jgi:hypothetical protein
MTRSTEPSNEDAFFAGAVFATWGEDGYPVDHLANTVVRAYLGRLGFDWTIVMRGASNAFAALLNEPRFTTDPTTKWFAIGLAFTYAVDAARKPGVSDAYLFELVTIFRGAMARADVPVDIIDFASNSIDYIRKAFTVSQRQVIVGAVEARLRSAATGEYADRKVEVYMGDVFKNISSSTIISRSTVENAFNQVQQRFGDDVANALLQVASAVASSGNKEAAENLNGFNEELQKHQPSKSVLKSLWQGLLEVLPSLATLGEATAKIVTLFR